jgi:hypothetical protein
MMSSQAISAAEFRAEPRRPRFLLASTTTADRGTADPARPMPSAPLEKRVVVIDAAVSDGGDNNVGSSPLALLVPLSTHSGTGPYPHPTTPAMAVPRGSSPGRVSHERPGLDAAAPRGRVPGRTRRPGMAGQGTVSDPGDRWQQQRSRTVQAAASRGCQAPAHAVLPATPTSQPKPEAAEGQKKPGTDGETGTDGIGDTWQQERQMASYRAA